MKKCEHCGTEYEGFPCDNHLPEFCVEVLKAQRDELTERLKCAEQILALTERLKYAEQVLRLFDAFVSANHVPREVWKQLVAYYDRYRNKEPRYYKGDSMVDPSFPDAEEISARLADLPPDNSAVEKALDAALAEVRRQGGPEYLLLEARNEGLRAVSLSPAPRCR